MSMPPTPDAIQAIETRYAGCRFRSRLEARWAVFFDHLAIGWEYEVQGFVLDGTPYLPDFWLPHQNLYYEVKPATLLADYRDRLGALAVGGKRRVVLAAGTIPRPDTFRVASVSDDPPFFMELFFPDGSHDEHYAWCRCEYCGATDVQFGGRSERNCACSPGDRGYGAHHPEILAAYEAARSARFEHREAG